MADIGVFHASIMAGGGAEAVGAHVLGALAGSPHEVTLYTADRVDADALEDRYGTSLPATLDVERPVPVGRAAVEAFAAAASAATGVTDLPLLRRAVLERRLAGPLARRHDLVVSTDGPLAAPGPVVQYVHFPYYDADAMRRFDTRFSERCYPTYHRVCRAVRPTGHGGGDGATVTVTNSEWTASVLAGAGASAGGGASAGAGAVNAAEDRSPTVVRPPVALDDFDPPPWEAMADGIVCVGRLHPLKRQHVAVEVVDELRDRGVETHLHVVGDAGSEAYARRLRELAAARPHVTLEGYLPRRRLVPLLERNRFGLHARRFEHFGIGIAEMVAGGALPLVHDSGGQTEVVAGRDELVYSSVPEAADKLERLLAAPDRARRLQGELRTRVDDYGADRFEAEVRSLVERGLDDAGVEP